MIELTRSLCLIVLGAIRAILGMRALVKLPSWSLFLSLAVSAIRAFIKGHATDLRTLRAITDTFSFPGIPMAAAYFKARLGGVTVEVVHPRHIKISKVKNNASLSMASYRVVMYLHGGGGAVCSPATHRFLTHTLAVEADAIVVVPQYRRVPENKLTDAVEDAFKVFSALITVHQVDIEKISVCGDSAGGAIAILTLIQIRDRLSPANIPACLGLLSPWSDFYTPPAVPRIDVDYLCPEILEFMSLLITQSGSAESDPINQSFRGFPPVLVQAGDSEILIDQIRKLAKIIQTESYENTTFIEYREMIHIPHLFSIMSPEGRSAMRDLATFIKINCPL